MHTIVPGEFLIFSAPDPAVPAGLHWLDVGGERRFSPAFHADLLRHLGATLVLRSAARLDEGDRAAFAGAGVELHALAEGWGRSASACLQAYGDFAEWAGRSRGLAAVCADDGAACALLAAHLVRRRLFSNGAEAAAWLRIAGPRAGGGGAAVDPAGLAPVLERPASERRMAARSASFCEAFRPSPSASSPSPLPPGSHLGGCGGSRLLSPSAKRRGSETSRPPEMLGEACQRGGKARPGPAAVPPSGAAAQDGRSMSMPPLPVPSALPLPPPARAAAHAGTPPDRRKQRARALMPRSGESSPNLFEHL